MCQDVRGQGTNVEGWQANTEGIGVTTVEVLSRTITTTDKIPTKFGAFYTHVEYTVDREIVGVSVSTSQRHESSDIEQLTTKIADSINDQIKQLAEV